MAESHEHSEDHGHGHSHGHSHGHENDRGLKGVLRYLRWFPQMWSSEINQSVVDIVAPSAGEFVLDIGAGIGAGAFPAAKAGARVAALEPTPAIRRALSARRFASRQRSRIEVIEGSAEHIPLADQSVDAIWAVNTMHHWVDVSLAASEIARVLRPGGRMFLVDEMFTDPSHPEFDKFGSEHGPEHHGFTLVNADEMGKLLSDVDVADVRAGNEIVSGRPVIAVRAGELN